MSQVKVIGHKSPDTDSICSAIVFAWYLREFRNIDAVAVAAGVPGREAAFVLDYFGSTAPEVVSTFGPEDKVVIVDTNNPEELLPGCAEAEVIEIIDHHKLSGLKTLKPLNVTDPYLRERADGTLEVMADARDNLSREMAGLMLAPIVSDTLKFTSPTTTGIDREVAGKLAVIAQVEIDEFASAMFAAKSDLTGMTAREVLLTDHKDFEFGAGKYKIAVLETTDPSKALAMHPELQSTAMQLKSEGDLNGVFFFVVDIISSSAKLLELDPEMTADAETAFASKFRDGIMDLPGITSRKAQIAPKLGEVLS